jgi:hypothetical protein
MKDGPNLWRNVDERCINLVVQKMLQVDRASHPTPYDTHSNDNL